jgi:hypothetical protein
VRLGVLVSDERLRPEKIEKRELCGRSREISRVVAAKLSPSAMRRSCQPDLPPQATRCGHQPDLPGEGMQEAGTEDARERIAASCTSIFPTRPQGTPCLILLYIVEAAPRVLVRLILPPATALWQSKAVPSVISLSRSRFSSSQSCEFKCRSARWMKQLFFLL